MITLLNVLKETNVVLGEVAGECETLHHLFLADRLRQQAKHNRAVIARMENAATIIRVQKHAHDNHEPVSVGTGNRPARKKHAYRTSETPETAR
jgi:hypothetical protein